MGRPKLFQCLMAHESEEIPSRFRGQRVRVQRKWAIYSEEMGGFARAVLFRGLGRVWTSWLLRIGAAQRASVVVRFAPPPAVPAAKPLRDAAGCPGRAAVGPPPGPRRTGVRTRRRPGRPWGRLTICSKSYAKLKARSETFRNGRSCMPWHEGPNPRSSPLETPFKLALSGSCRAHRSL